MERRETSASNFVDQKWLIGISLVEILPSVESFDADKIMVKTILQHLDYQSMYVVTGS